MVHTMSSNRLSPTCHSFVLGAGMFGWTLTHAHANIVSTQVQIILHTERVFGQDSLGEEKITVLMSQGILAIVDVGAALIVF